MPSIDISRYSVPKRKESKNTNLSSQPPAKKVAGFKGKSIQDILTMDISLGGKDLSDKKKEYLYLELSSLLKAGIDLKRSIELIASEVAAKKDKDLWVMVQESVLRGSSFSQALEMTERFSSYEVFSIQIGEETGKLIAVLEDLARFYQSKIKQQRKITGALTYPVIVLTTSFGAVFFMLKFVVPMFGDVFKRFGGKLPWITEQIITASEALKNNFWPGLGILMLILTILFSLRRTERFQKIASAILLKIPVVGNLIQKIYLARFCNSMRLLINAKLPLLNALGLLRKMIRYYPIDSTINFIEEDILRGKAFYESLQRFKIYPSKMVQLVKVGEETHQLDYFFGIICEQYLEEVEYTSSTLSSVLEPLIIIFMGLIVGLILISMYLPLFQMSNSF